MIHKARCEILKKVYETIIPYGNDPEKLFRKLFFSRLHMHSLDLSSFDYTVKCRHCTFHAP